MVDEPLDEVLDCYELRIIESRLVRFLFMGAIMIMTATEIIYIESYF